MTFMRLFYESLKPLESEALRKAKEELTRKHELFQSRIERFADSTLEKSDVTYVLLAAFTRFVERAKTVIQLLGADRYNPEVLAIIQEVVNASVSLIKFDAAHFDEALPSIQPILAAEEIEYLRRFAYPSSVPLPSSKGKETAESEMVNQFRDHMKLAIEAQDALHVAKKVIRDKQAVLQSNVYQSADAQSLVSSFNAYAESVKQLLQLIKEQHENQLDAVPSDARLRELCSKPAAHPLSSSEGGQLAALRGHADVVQFTETQQIIKNALPGLMQQVEGAVVVVIQIAPAVFDQLLPALKPILLQEQIERLRPVAGPEKEKTIAGRTNEGISS